MESGESSNHSEHEDNNNLLSYRHENDTNSTGTATVSGGDALIRAQTQTMVEFNDWIEQSSHRTELENTKNELDDSALPKDIVGGEIVYRLWKDTISKKINTEEHIKTLKDLIALHEKGIYTDDCGKDLFDALCDGKIDPKWVKVTACASYVLCGKSRRDVMICELEKIIQNKKGDETLTKRCCAVRAFSYLLPVPTYFHRFSCQSLLDVSPSKRLWRERGYGLGEGSNVQLAKRFCSTS